MKRVAIAVGSAAAAATGIVAAAGTASAAPSCPAPAVTVSPQNNVSQDGSLTITAKDLFCTTSTKSGSVDFVLRYPGYASSASVTGITVRSGGTVTYVWKLSSKFYTEPAGTKVPLLLTVTAPGSTESVVVQGPTITLAAPPAGAGKATSGWNVAPTAVPAGHVDVARDGGARPWETGALALGGIALVAGGAVAVTRRHAVKH